MANYYLNLFLELALNQDKHYIKDTSMFLCNDNKIHIRFKKYNCPEVLSGFESKLTFILTSLFKQFSLRNLRIIEDNKKMSKKDFWNKYLSLFKQSEEYQSILKILSFKIHGLKGITFLPSYKSLSDKNLLPILQFGEMTFIIDDYLKNKSKFKLTYTDLIFDDSIKLKLQYDFNSKNEINSKFIKRAQNKRIRQLNKSQNKITFKHQNLWN